MVPSICNECLTYLLTNSLRELMNSCSCEIEDSRESTSGGSVGCLSRRLKLTESPFGVVCKHQWRWSLTNPLNLN